MTCLHSNVTRFGVVEDERDDTPAFYVTQCDACGTYASAATPDKADADFKAGRTFSKEVVN